MSAGGEMDTGSGDNNQPHVSSPHYVVEHNDGAAHEDKPRTSLPESTVSTDTSSKNPKKTRQIDPNKLAAGTSSDAKSFVSVHNSEPKVAAYLGYTRLDEYRKFSFSYHVIPFLIKYMELSAETSKAGALELLQNLKDPDKDFPEDFDKALAKYPLTHVKQTKKKEAKIERKKNANYLLATLLYRCSENLVNHQPVDAEQIQAKQAEAMTLLHEYFGGAKDKLSPPHSPDVLNFKLPELGPHTDMGEDMLERYNRIWNLFHAFHHDLAPSRWKSKYETRKLNFYEPTLIHPSSKPLWMVQPELSNEAAFKGNTKVTSAQKKEFAAHRAAGEEAALAADEPLNNDRCYPIQAAFTGAETQVGPPIDPCKVALGMRTVGKHETLNELDVSVCDTLPGCDIRFLDSQINGAAFMLQRSLGYIPISPERATDEEISTATKSLDSICTQGGYLVDSTDFGKTMTALLFANYYAEYADHSTGHRPISIITPNGAVLGQWVDIKCRHFRGLTPILSCDDRPPQPKYLSNWVSSTAMREAPGCLDQWPPDLEYVFDTKDPRASKTVIITPYDTHKERTLMTTWKKTKKAKVDKGDEQAKGKRKKHYDEEPIFESKWRGRYSLVIADEGHRIRHPDTKTFASISKLEAPVNWFLSATPVMNSFKDILGGLMVLWPAVSHALNADKEAVRWLEGQPAQGYKIFDSLQSLPKNDIRRTTALDPHRIEKLLLSNDVQEVSLYYHHIDELISIRLPTASKIPPDHAMTGFVESKSMMPKDTVKKDIEHIEPLTQEDPIDEAEIKENLAFLSGGGATHRRQATPHAFYSKDDREAMLNDHDGYDILTTEGKDAKRNKRKVADTQPPLADGSPNEDLANPPKKKTENTEESRKTKKPKQASSPPSEEGA